MHPRFWEVETGHICSGRFEPPLSGIGGGGGGENNSRLRKFSSPHSPFLPPLTAPYVAAAVGRLGLMKEGEKTLEEVDDRVCQIVPTSDI